MANIDMCYLMFDDTIKRVVDHFKLDGKVYKDNLFHLYLTRITFVFTHEYLSIHDMIDYHQNEITKKSVLDDTVKHLKEIEFQFRYYFNAIWC